MQAFSMQYLTYIPDRLHGREHPGYVNTRDLGEFYTLVLLGSCPDREQAYQVVEENLQLTEFFFCTSTLR